MRPWLLFSSSSGETFRALHHALEPEAKESLQGFFTDRPCPAAGVARSMLAGTPVVESDRKTFEASVLEWVRSRDLQNAVVLLCGFSEF